MKSYPPEVQDKINLLEKELNELKQTGKVILQRPDVEELSKLTGLYSSQFHSNISWLSRSVCGFIEKDRFYNGAYRKTKCTKLATDLSYEETKVASKCAAEIVDVLLKYAKRVLLCREKDEG